MAGFLGLEDAGREGVRDRHAREGPEEERARDFDNAGMISCVTRAFALALVRRENALLAGRR